MLRYLNAGESHGKNLTAILEGLPAGLPLGATFIDRELKRRQCGYGRGGRMAIESDSVDVTSGLRGGLTLGSPLTLVVNNRDWENWQDVMGPEGPLKGSKARALTSPRPGHADLAGGLKYGHKDLRNILERSSARETAARVAVGAVAKRLLEEVGINVYSWVETLGGVSWEGPAKADPAKLFARAEKSVVRCPDIKTTLAMKKRIDEAREAGDSLGGVYRVAVTGVLPGLGSHVHWDRKLDGLLAGALMSIQATKGVEVGLGFEAGFTPGSLVHDEIFRRKAAKNTPSYFWPEKHPYYRKTNRAGGIEGGTSNGETIRLRAVMKPIPTLYKPLRSVDILTGKTIRAGVERSDVCALPAAAVVAEAAVAFTVAAAYLEKFGGDSMSEIKRNVTSYIRQVLKF
ncbi:MAG: chorismate synthase [Thermodesulfobacteriota bacterium]